VGGGLTATLPGVDPVMDPESRAWVAALAGEGGDREAALERLHALRAEVAEVLTDARRKLRAHLAGCLACREEHESLRALVAGDTG
jgi:hypothetical protein